MNTRFPRYLAAVTVCLAGCGDLLKQPYPAKALFGIEPGMPDVSVAMTPPARPDGYINRDASVVGTTPARGRQRHAGATGADWPPRTTAWRSSTATGRRSTRRTTTANFIAPPAALLTGGLTDWLDRAGPAPVVLAGSAVRPDLVLDAEVTKLLIDRSDRLRPKATISARFFLTRDAGNGSPIVSDTAYTVDVPVSPDTPAGYADGWGRAWRQVLERLARDLGPTVPRAG